MISFEGEKKKQKQTTGLGRMSLRPQTEQVCISVERKHTGFSASSGTCVYQAEGANGSIDIHFPHEENSWSSVSLPIPFKDRNAS